MTALELSRERLAGRVVLAVFPHPDDEAWVAGGLLRRAIAAGARVHLVTLSAGERGTDRAQPHALRRGEAMAAARRVELARAAAALGITSFEVLALPDAGLEVKPALEALRVVADRLGLGARDVAVGFDVDGGYGHRDHVACAEAMLALGRERGACVLGARFPRGLLEPVRDRVLKHRPELVAPALQRGPLGGAADVATTTFDVHLDDAEAAAKRAALAAHVSQLGPGADAVLGFLGPGVLAAVARVERFVCLTGALPA